jgi:membrane dipeptidase
MKIIDTHCDTISCLLDSGKNLYKNNIHIDIDRMRHYDGYAQFFAAFIDPVYYKSARQRCLDIIKKLYNELDLNSDNILLCKNAYDYDEAMKEEKIGAFLSIEGGECIPDINTLELYYELGVRCIALTWNNTNHIASGVMENNPEFGLTDFGREVVSKMNELGILIDVSHLHEKAFWDVVRVTKKPVIASHSNAKSICSHKRNLTDEQFREIVNMGGYVGLNFCPAFLADGGNAGILDILRHAEHFLSIGGEKYIGFGADFDGVEKLPEGICGCESYYAIEKSFLNYGIGQTVISAIEHHNFERILHEYL